MRSRFDEHYFRCDSAYASLGSDPLHAKILIQRWYAGLFRYSFRRWLRWLPRAGKALDVGCGFGACLQLLSDRGFEPFGVDVSKFAVDISQADAPSSAQVAVSDIQIERPFANEDFDLVLCFEVLEHLDDLESGLGNLAQCLRTEGVAWITTPNPHFTLPPYDAWADPTHVNVLPLEDWLQHLEKSRLIPRAAATFVHLPLLYRMGESFSFIIPTGNWGPSYLILAQRVSGDGFGSA